MSFILKTKYCLTNIFLVFIPRFSMSVLELVDNWKAKGEDEEKYTHLLVPGLAICQRESAKTYDYSLACNCTTSLSP